jgi:hypothetical protein
MQRHTTAFAANAGKVAASLLMLVTGAATAAPVIQQITGTLDHKGIVTISGAGRALPLP